MRIYHDEIAEVDRSLHLRTRSFLSSQVLCSLITAQHPYQSIMAGSNAKDIPSWQKSADTSATKDPLDPSDPPSESPEPRPLSRTELLAQAKTFLEHEEIRDSTTEAKVTFLESKGLTNEEIQGLLGVSRNEDEDSAAQHETTTPVNKEQTVGTSGLSYLNTLTFNTEYAICQSRYSFSCTTRHYLPRVPPACQPSSTTDYHNSGTERLICNLFCHCRSIWDVHISLPAHASFSDHRP